jgi:hypothetical protein
MADTLNPYAHLVPSAASSTRDVLRRIRWDIDPQSWASRRKLTQLRNSHQGKKAVIVCNGPSLLKSDLSLLRNVYTFGLNKINLLFDKSDFRPSCIVAVNRFVIEQSVEFYQSTSIPLFLDSVARRYIKPRSSVCFLHSTSRMAFAKDCSLSLYQGYTVTFVAMQLAYHMGFADVAIIGCDHQFAAQGPANAEVASGARDASHFDPRYFSGGVKWNLPDLDGSEIAYILARQAYSASEKRLLNATVGGNLHVLPRMSLKDFILGG